MKTTEHTKKVIKFAFDIFLFGGLAIAIIYLFLNIRKPEQNTVIDNTITYTTTYISEKSIPLNVTPSPEKVVASIDKFVTVPEGGVDWKLLAETKSIPYKFEGEDGEILHGVQPKFAPGLKILDGQEIIMQGYMFPLAAAEDQSSFLFGPFPVSCPYHYHVGPALVIEAHGHKKIDFSYKAITLKGTIELIPREDNYNIFYRLRNAQLVN